MQTHLKLDEVIDALSLLVIEPESETELELPGAPVIDAEADEVMLVPGREIEGREMGKGSVVVDEEEGADVIDAEPDSVADADEAESLDDGCGLKIDEKNDERGSTLVLEDDAESDGAPVTDCEAESVPLGADVIVADAESDVLAGADEAESLDVGCGLKIDERMDERGSTAELEDEAESVGAAALDPASVLDGASVVDAESEADAVADAESLVAALELVG